MSETEIELLLQDVEALTLNLNNVIKTVNRMLEAAKAQETAINSWAEEVERRIKKLQSYNSVITDGVVI